MADAIEDKRFLESAFIDTGLIDVLTNTGNPKCILIGRTGSGKTALLEKLNSSQERIIRLEPESLALTYISTNNTLKFFIAAGVKMELFYKLLWRHIFAVELIKERYNIVNATSRDGFLQEIWSRLSKNKAREEALEYLLEWGSSFWEETDYRVKEITKKFETDLEASLGTNISAPLDLGSVNLNAKAAELLSEEQKSEVIYHGQNVVNAVQIKKLSDIIELLEKDILEDKQKSFFITIDRLDENWITDELRYPIIRALLETVRDFNNKIQNVKIIVALREDLIDRVFRMTRDSGYQEEKYKSMYALLKWNETELEELLDLRVNELVKEQFTNKQVTTRALLPNSVSNVDPIKYIVARTMYRPRDIIMFFNKCIEVAQDKVKVTQTHLLSAEGEYSLDRLRALADEWSADYSVLPELVQCLRGYPKYFKLSDENMKDEMKESLFKVLTTWERQYDKEDDVYQTLISLFYSDQDDLLLEEYLKILYRVGVVGIKPEKYLGVQWSFKGDKLSFFRQDAVIHIHPAFHRVLGIDGRDAAI